MVPNRRGARVTRQRPRQGSGGCGTWSRSAQVVQVGAQLLAANNTVGCALDLDCTFGRRRQRWHHAASDAGGDSSGQMRWKSAGRSCCRVTPVTSSTSAQRSTGTPRDRQFDSVCGETPRAAATFSSPRSLMTFASAFMLGKVHKMCYPVKRSVKLLNAPCGYPRWVDEKPKTPRRRRTTSDEESPSYARLLRACRDARGWTGPSQCCRELARYNLEYSEAVFGNWKSRGVPAQAAIEIGRVLGVRPTWIVFGSGSLHDIGAGQQDEDILEAIALLTSLSGRARTKVIGILEDKVRELRAVESAAESPKQSAA